jgi:hypothetical protein
MGLRRWSLRTLTLVTLLMALDVAGHLGDRFNAGRRLVNSWRLKSRVVGRTYQGWVKAIDKVSPRLLRAMVPHLRAQMPGLAGEHWKVGRWIPFGADGSKFNLSRTLAHLKRFSSAGKKRSGPQAYVTGILHLRTGLPWAARIGRADIDERAHLRQLIGHLPAAALLVADAGFMGYGLWWFLGQTHVHFLIRVGANVSLLTHLGYGVRQHGDLVYLWPHRERRAGKPPLILRLIRVRDGDKEMCLITNELDPAQLSFQEARECYRLRWQIELWYRQLKQTAGRRQLASHAPRQATLELAWLLVGMALLGMVGVQDALCRGEDPLRLSPAGMLRVVRELSARPRLHGGIRTLRRLLMSCVKDGYQRKAPKCRQKWPTKKRQKPPGVPRIAQATVTQVAAANALYVKLITP